MTIKVKKPLFRRKLHISNSPYYLERSQKDGESDLVRISRKAKREDSWMFYEDTNLWLHLKNDHSENNSQSGGIEMSCTAPAVYESPLGKEPVHYNVHPDLLFQGIVENVEVSNDAQRRFLNDVLLAYHSLPSDDDFQLVTGPGRGYEHRIVTSRGVTVMKSDPEVSDVEIGNLDEFLKREINLQTFMNE